MNDDAETYKNAFVQLMQYLREIAEDEETDLNDPHSRGRASGIHAVLLAVDSVLVASAIDRRTVGLENLNAESWFER